MRFARTLISSKYEPWESEYIDYVKLKSLLRENEAVDNSGTPSWTDEDEGRFVEELVNIQLEKVNTFQRNTYKALRERTTTCEVLLEGLVGSSGRADSSQDSQRQDFAGQEHRLREALHKLDCISDDIKRLEKFSRINYAGFLKAAKKHDRRRGLNYKIRPLLLVRLAELPFNSEDYSPLLYRLSAMYSYVIQSLNGSTEVSQSMSELSSSEEKYTSYKFFVHPDNLLEVKTHILRRLPVLVYKPQTLKIVEGSQKDPTTTSLYFDNSRFALYTRKVEKAMGASTLRLRWFGQLTDKPDIFLEMKTSTEGDGSKGKYKMEKSIHKLQDRIGDNFEELQELESNVRDIQNFLRENELEPVLRSNYTRTAFQIPGDNRVRISLDTNIAMIREDSMDSERPCRKPEQWYRTDVDVDDMDFPFPVIRKGEITRFPYAVLEIKLRDVVRKNTNEWVEDLMSSHLVKQASRFSKFVHGVAQLFEDHVNIFPFWLSSLEANIIRDTQAALQEEQQKKGKQAEDEFAVGSFIGSKPGTSFQSTIGSSRGSTPGMRTQSVREDRLGFSNIGASIGTRDHGVREDDSDGGGLHTGLNQATVSGGYSSILPSLSTSKYAIAHRHVYVQQLPSGVHEPGQLMKDSGPIRVEPKVWLANQRTFVKWEHISVLLATLSLSLYNAAGESNNVARGLAIVYTSIAIFAGMWGWWMYILRSRMIEQRSGKDFDNIIGPVVVCTGLTVALCLNFGFKIGYHYWYT